ncbi:MAG: aminotransferase class V-fold PLP-dependent enzyme [Oscillospiraceae bacterium]
MMRLKWQIGSCPLTLAAVHTRLLEMLRQLSMIQRNGSVLFACDWICGCGLHSICNPSLNQVLNGLDLTRNSVIYVSPYEHNAVARTVYQLSVHSGASVEMIPLTDDLQLDLEKAKYQFSMNAPSVVILNALSNVTGYVLPVAELFLMAKEYGAITVLDAAQAAGLIDLNMPTLNADILCFAGHKTLMGPFGIGGFLIKHGITLKKVFDRWNRKCIFDFGHARRGP